jgi:hypothetical protein
VKEVDLSKGVDLGGVGLGATPMTEEEETELLASALLNITRRLERLEAEQAAMDANMSHIAQALEAIIETTVAKLGIEP